MIRNKAILNLLTVSLVFVAGCKCPAPAPPRPGQVRGWQEWNEGRPPYSFTLHYVGELILNKGESSDNGKIGVRVVEIIPGQCTTFLGEPRPPRVKFQFFRAADSQVVCDVTTEAGGPLQCKGLDDIQYVNVLTINSKEGWVHLNLLK
jgi:hypothetical protein